MRSAVVLAMAALVLVPGLLLSGSASGGGVSLDVCPPAAGASHGQSLGSVLDTHASVFVRNSSKPGDTVNQNFKLFAGNSVCTDSFGEVSFKAKTGGTTATCDAGANARFSLEVKNKELVIDLISKRSRALIACDSKNVIFVPPQKRTLTSSHAPVFALRVGPDRSVLTVAQGFLKLAPPAGGVGALIIGPGEQTTILAARKVPVAVPRRLEPAERQLLSKFVAGLPPPIYARPSSPVALKRSAALKRIGQRRTMVVGLGPTLGRSDPGAFARAYFRFLAAKWNVAVSFVSGLRSARAAKLLGNGRIDLFVSQSPPRKTLTAPFFGDHAGDSWRFVVASDPVFLGALTSFLGSALDSGDYNALYRRTFRDSPLYRVVASLLFPPVACAPRANADLSSYVDLNLRMASVPSGPIRPGEKVTQTVTVTNIGKRVVDCVTLHLHLFGGVPLNYVRLRASGCTRLPAQPGQAVDELELSCELGRFGLGGRKSLPVVVRASAARHTETCADVDADESGGVPEVNRSDNSACAQLVYRSAPLMVGAADDSVAQSVPAVAQARMDLLHLAGFDAVIVSAGWTRKQGAVPDVDLLARLGNAVDAARVDHMQVLLIVTNADTADTPVTSADRTAFAAYAATLADDLPAVHDFIVGNEPNNGQFWSPQYAGRADASPTAYVKLLAQTYDALKEGHLDRVVIGGALAPRGVDSPDPAGHDTHSPGTFITLMGQAYAALGRSRPIMDAFALHPIPDSPSVLPGAVHPRPSTEIGIGDYDSLVSLLARAFGGASFPIYYTEYGVQTATASEVVSAKDYVHSENAQTDDLASPAVQAARYSQALALASCQSSVAGLFLFHAFDDRELDRWQSGIYYVDGTPKESFGAVSRALKVTGARDVSSCPPG